MKNALLSSLGGNGGEGLNISYMKDICLCISSIAAVEIPLGLWNNFIETMASAS